jgi:hypothetical protein
MHIAFIFLLFVPICLLDIGEAREMAHGGLDNTCNLRRQGLMSWIAASYLPCDIQSNQRYKILTESFTFTRSEIHGLARCYVTMHVLLCLSPAFCLGTNSQPMKRNINYNTTSIITLIKSIIYNHASIDSRNNPYPDSASYLSNHTFYETSICTLQRYQTRSF